MSSSTFRRLTSRSFPLLTASALSFTLYTVHTHYSPLLAEAADPLSSPIIKKQKSISAVPPPFSTYGWGSNKNLTLFPDNQVANVKKPVPLTQLGTTPLRDLVLSEEYGACVDARGDLWMWGKGYDESGELGRSLKGKSLKSLAPATSKLYALSKNGHLYAIPSSKSLQCDRQDKSTQSWWSYLFSTDPGVDFVELSASGGGLGWGERWVDVSVGRNHLLAVTNKGRTFSLALNEKANSHRQLGTKQEFEQPSIVQTILGVEFPSSRDIRFQTTLQEIPSLKGIKIQQVASSERTSFVRTDSGHVLGFGANENGQIGLGSSSSVDIIPVPVEVVLAKCYPSGTKIQCTDVKAGGLTTFFTIKRFFPGRQGHFIDVLGCGSGISGALGTGMYTSATGMPVRVKTISGLQEYSEKAQTFLPIGIHNLSISPSSNTHVYATLDTVTLADAKGVQEGKYGKDVMAWGANVDYQIGNGKRSSTAIPQHLPPLGGKPSTAPSGGLIDALSGEPKEEESLSSGTQSPMPHSRLQLHIKKANAYDLNGNLIKRKVKCEETMVAGYNASVMYNKIIE
ncbi:hypothetical protein I203_101415 [Kwoniella mangroviensis CBS 8507]|uniref:uncharacterized protein n=1 Tax=Kwoniella mangroviensis CBS 8507 TaxID=1296122 RepID=UPI00080CFA48|nr:uncharacterized protein I203_05469 [Kwoniella mangroviensis CBS 8507]OCF65224.1 hypothetical protein I203_05469 [Kwoniella mangroviensis CBS 8507]